jgi:hypothetical protein
VLRQYSDDGELLRDEHGKYEAGRVKIWREPAADTDSHGTAIILTDVRPQTRDTLQSRDLWDTIDSDGSLDPAKARDLVPPAYHIGRLRSTDSDALEGDGEPYDSLPWSQGDPPETTFKKLVESVWQQVDHVTPHPQLERVFDYYLQMVWQLSLAIPGPYVAGNPFDLLLRDKLYLYEIPPSTKASAIPFELTGDETINKRMSIGSVADIGSDFTVLVDDLRLARPLLFANLPTTAHAVKKPILFVGRCREEFEGIPTELTGGTLEFEAYLMWAPKIAPAENRGVLIRVHGSSGTLFDPTFMRYQISEQTRMRQISCEIFVSEGFEAALNIDRESFNYAHPHVVYITKWLHASLRRLATVQKKIAGDIRQAQRKADVEEEKETLTSIASGAWRYESDDPGAQPPPVAFLDAASETTDTQPGTYHFSRQAVFGEQTRQQTLHHKSTERKLKTIVQLLSAYGILESLTSGQQERLLAGMRKILETSAK